MVTHEIRIDRTRTLLEEPNTGAQAKAWWYYSGVSPSFVSAQLTQHSARLVDRRPGR